MRRRFGAMMAVAGVAMMAVAGVAAAHGGLRHGHRCGNDHPAVAGHLNRTVVVERSQVYHTREEVARRRGLADHVQVYPGVAFITAQEAEEAGIAEFIRITIVWDVVHSGDTEASTEGNPAQCSSEGQTYDYPSGGSWVTSDDPCAAKDVVTEGNAKYEQMLDRTEWAVGLWKHGLKIKPVQDAIVVDAAITASFPLTTSTYEDTDLVVIMTARPQPDAPIAGYAVCLQRDQYGRCTVGQFNWVPGYVNTAEGDAPSTIADERHTAVHELAHVFGAVIPGATFRTETGTARPLDEIFFTAPALVDDSVESSRDVSYIKTQRVLEVARDAYDCPDAAGVPLEDVPLGRGSHWEGRVLGPEVMSYGSGSGDTYISSLTLALLEDTNQYVANYSIAGTLTLVDTADVGNVNRGALTSSAVRFKKSDLRADFPDGYPTYGRKAGCDFLYKHPRSWPAYYTCAKQQEYLCTADKRMSAVCALQTGLTVEGTWSCAEPSATDPGCANQQSQSCDSGGFCGIPPEQQFFASDSAAAAAFAGFDLGGTAATKANTGGFSSAMDYAVVPVGFWSCMESAGAGNSTGRVSQESDGFDLGQLVGTAASDMSVFGGQTRCTTCRCFVSSLVGFSRLAFFNPLFPKYGLCYVANCAKEDLLQVGVRNQLDRKISWYRCPPAGGKIWIAGFSGSLHCPPAKEMCLFENELSGVLYPETDRLLEIYLYGALAVVLLAIFCVCTCRPLRERAVICSKHHCGVTAFLEEEISVRSGEPARLEALENAEPQAPPRRPAIALLAVNTMTMAVGLFLTAYGIYYVSNGVLFSAAMPMIALGVVVVLVSVVGIVGANQPSVGASCTLVLYFYLVLFVFLTLVGVFVYALAAPNVMQAYVDDNFEWLSRVLPSSAYDQGAPRERQVDQATAYIRSNVIGVAAAGLVTALVFLGALFASGFVIGRKTTTATMFAVLSYTCALAGVALLVSGAVGVAQGSPITILGYLSLAAGIILLVLGATGIRGVTHRGRRVILAVGILASLFAAAFVVGAGYLFLTAAAVRRQVLGLSDDQLAAQQNDYGVAMGRPEFALYVEDLFYREAIGYTIAAVVTILLAVAAFRFRLDLIAFHQAVRDDISARRARRAKGIVSGSGEDEAGAGVGGVALA